MPVLTSRLSWIDLMRGLAVVGMLATHAVNAFLHPDYENAAWRQEFQSYSGLVAPSFFWIAGYVQGLAIRRAHREGRQVAGMRRWQRLGIILLIGYLLHVPLGYWLKGDFGAESWKTFLQVDALQCLAASLAMLLGLGVTGARWFDGLVLMAGAAAVFLAPLAGTWGTGLLFVDAWLNYDTGSLFPLFPWFGFAAAGCLASRWEPSWKGYVPLAALLIAAGYVFEPISWSYAHPTFFGERLGWVCLIAAAVHGISRWLAPQWLLLAGRESLLVYVSHLLILFSIPFTGKTLVEALGPTLAPWQVILLSVALVVVCLWLAALNERRK
ncbi:MAG TPA: heparan-alpha-glucosaminide N-acetyltransferase domain-containing protein, partial [Verrucomicrobium sp.]|nr:heparan-alpha-glucosaminide N-acetyltransferase domain-containing protein [Verrucomicrobium sp.]